MKRYGQTQTHLVISIQKKESQTLASMTHGADMHTKITAMDVIAMIYLRAQTALILLKTRMVIQQTKISKVTTVLTYRDIDIDVFPAQAVMIRAHALL